MGTGGDWGERWGARRGLGREDGPTVVWFKSVSSSLSCGGGGGSRGSVCDGPRPCLWGGAQKPSHIALEGLPLAARHREHGVKAWGSGRGTPTHSVDSWAPSVPDTLPGVTAGSGAGSPGHQCGAAPRGSPFVPGRAPRSSSLGEGRSFSPPPRRPGRQPTRARGPWGHHLLPPWVCVPPPAGASSLLTDRYKRAAAHLHRPPPPSAAETRAQSRDRARGAVQGHSLSCNQSDPLLLLLISATVSVQVWPQPLEFVK